MSSTRFVFATLALIAAMVAGGTPAWAGPQWCEEDPEFIVNGAVVDVTTLFPSDYAKYVTGTVNFDMQVPTNVVAYTLALPGTIPVTAQVRKTLPAYYGIGKIPVIVTVTMTSSVGFQTYTQVTGTQGLLVSGIYGTSTKPTDAKFSMYGASLWNWSGSDD